MSAPVTPPPAAADAWTPKPPRRSSARTISIVLIALGAVLLTGAALIGIGTALRVADIHTVNATANATGVRNLDVSISAGDLTIVFDERATEATLDVTGSGAEDWHLTRDDDALTIRTKGGWLFGDWVLPPWGAGANRGTLTLPAALAGVDAELEVSAGSITAHGAFGDVDLDLGAGDLDVTGSASTLTMDVDAGRATVDLDGVNDAVIEVSAGDVDGVLTGTAPERLEVRVSAGSADLIVPHGVYAVVSDVSAGSFDNGLDTSVSSSKVVTVNVSAGSVTLQSGR